MLNVCTSTPSLSLAALSQQSVCFSLQNSNSSQSTSSASSSGAAKVIQVKEKTLAEVAGEYVLRPMIDKVTYIWKKAPSFNLPTVAAAETNIQRVITLNPGEHLLTTCTRKIALCKSGKSAWDDDYSCSHPGPNMFVEVKYNGGILFSGTMGDSMQWVYPCTGGALTLYIKNRSDKASSMYVHTEDNGKCGWPQCTIM
jgi:hypothetical protein